MPRYASGLSKQELEKLILEQLRKRFKEDVKALPASSIHFAQLTPHVLKDMSKIGADFSTAAAKNEPLKDMLGLQEISIPFFLSRAANPTFHQMRRDLQREYEFATGKLTFLGLLAEKKGKPPVFFLIYANGTELRAYVPKIGNSTDKKNKDVPANAPLNKLFDFEAMKKDIQSRIYYISDDGLSFVPDAKLTKPKVPKPGLKKIN